jgi:nucleotide-binding universal stress UspA family protein
MSHEPLDVVVEEARGGYDLVVIGVSEALGLQPTLLGTGHERLAQECPASLLIVHKWVEGGATAGVGHSA